jgi:hypothetical protein
MFEFGGGVRRFDFELYTVSLEDVSRKVIIFLYAEPAADLTRRASQLYQCAVQIEYSDTFLEVNYGYSSRNIRYYVGSLYQVGDAAEAAAQQERSPREFQKNSGKNPTTKKTNPDSTE